MSALTDTTPNPFVGKLRRSILLTSDLDYHVIRASMAIIFVLFGYQKWWAYEAERLVPFISNGPLISWLYLVFSHLGELVTRPVRMDLRRATACRLLE